MRTPDPRPHSTSTYVWFAPAPQFALYTVYVPFVAEDRGMRACRAITLNLSSNLILTRIYSNSSRVLLILLAPVYYQLTCSGEKTLAHTPYIAC